MTICIPSYQRAGDVLTLDMLGDAFTRDEIIISTQTLDDYEKYQKLYKERAIVIFRKGESAPCNRNTLLDFCQQNGIKECVQIDDDVRHIRTIDGRKLKGYDFRNLMEQCFMMVRDKNVALFGGYCTDNKCQMKRNTSQTILVGMLLGITDTSIRFDESFTTKEDYELSLRMMKQGKRVIRFNSFAPSARHLTKGGCYDEWQSGSTAKMARLLVDMYPTLVTMHPSRKGEVKFIG